MKTALIRLDGVLVPPIWHQIAQVAGIPGLIQMHHSVMPDEDTLLEKRMTLLRKRGLTLDDLLFILSMHAPYEGAAEFVDALLNQNYRVVIVSDTLPELARYFTSMLGNVELRTEDDSIFGKDWGDVGDSRPNPSTPAGISAETAAALFIGHTVSDVPLLRWTGYSFLFRPSPRTALLAHGTPVVRHYHQIVGELALATRPKSNKASAQEARSHTSFV